MPPTPGTRSTTDVCPDPGPGTRWPLILAAVAGVAHLAVAARYGWHRDEFYYLACGLRPAWGYVDHPPLVPLLGRLGWSALGESLVGLRLPAILAHVALVALCGRLAREMGGGRWAQIVAALAALLAPILLSVSAQLTSVVFDVLLWTVAALLLVRLLRTGEPRLWIALGVVFGIGLLTKYTVVLLGAGLVVGLGATDARRWLRTPWPWVAAALAIALWLPNAVWQAQHGWPFLDFSAHNGENVRADQTRLGVLAEWALLPGPGGALLAVAGLWALARAPWTRPLAWTAAAVGLTILALNAKAYYVAGLYPLTFTAGAVAIEAHAARGHRWVRPAVVGALAVGIAAVPMVLPVLPLRTALAWGVADDYAEQLGWPAFVGTLADVSRSLSPADRADAVILARSYGQAGAVERFGASLGLPPVVSGHNSYGLWARPDTLTARVVIAPFESSSYLREFWHDCTRAATLDNRLRVENEEQGTPVWVCRGPRRSWAAMWQELRHND